MFYLPPPPTGHSPLLHNLSLYATPIYRPDMNLYSCYRDKNPVFMDILLSYNSGFTDYVTILSLHSPSRFYLLIRTVQNIDSFSFGYRGDRTILEKSGNPSYPLTLLTGEVFFRGKWNEVICFSSGRGIKYSREEGYGPFWYV